MAKMILLLSVCIFLSLSAAWCMMVLRVTCQKTVVTAPLQFEILPGDSLAKVAEHLHKARIPIQPFGFKLFAHQRQLADKLKVGEYTLLAGMSSGDILALFASGKTKQYALTIPEGWTFKQVVKALQQSPYLQHTLQGRSDVEILTLLGALHSHPEGLFFPDTYFFNKNSTDLALLRRAYQKMQAVLDEEWQHRSTELPLENPYHALILASIIEKETAVADERERIAGVFVRRLQKGMLLQTDPTVIYGLGDTFDGNLRRQDLKNPTAYNTYVVKGLPPTPIALPGRASIHAALHPEAGDALYFVANGNGRHVFSANLTEHSQWVNKYQLKP